MTRTPRARPPHYGARRRVARVAEGESRSPSLSNDDRAPRAFSPTQQYLHLSGRRNTPRRASQGVVIGVKKTARVAIGRGEAGRARERHPRTPRRGAAAAGRGPRGNGGGDTGRRTEPRQEATETRSTPTATRRDGTGSAPAPRDALPPGDKRPSLGETRDPVPADSRRGSRGRFRALHPPLVVEDSYRELPRVTYLDDGRELLRSAGVHGGDDELDVLPRGRSRQGLPDARFLPLGVRRTRQGYTSARLVDAGRYVDRPWSRHHFLLRRASSAGEQGSLRLALRPSVALWNMTRSVRSARFGSATAPSSTSARGTGGKPRASGGNFRRPRPPPGSTHLGFPSRFLLRARRRERPPCIASFLREHLSEHLSPALWSGTGVTSNRVATSKGPLPIPPRPGGLCPNKLRGEGWNIYGKRRRRVAARIVARRYRVVSTPERPASLRINRFVKPGGRAGSRSWCVV